MNVKLRSVLLTTTLVAASLGTIFYTGCKEDKCQSIVCANGGVCQEGGCICPSGFEGAQCEVTNRARFRGTWQVSEDGSVSASAEYPVVVSDGSGQTQVLIKNFHNSITENVVARVAGDSIYIEPQTFKNGYRVEGQGYITDDKFYGVNGRIVLKYKITSDLGVIDNYGYDNIPDNPSGPSIWTK